MGEWVIGAFINLFGSIAINFGTNLLKLGHDEDKVLLIARFSKHCVQVLTKWERDVMSALGCGNKRTAGLLFFALGNCLNFLSFGYAAQSLLAALGSVQFVVMVATAFIVLGNIFLVAFGNHQSPVYTPEQLAEKYSNITFLLYCLILVLVVTLHQYLYRRGELLLTVPGHDLKSYWHMLLPFSYAVVSGAVGSYSVLFAKSLSNLLRLSMSSGYKLHSWFMYSMLLLFLSTAGFWMARLNEGLSLFDAILIVPMFQIAWTFFSICTGFVYFQEFQVFDALRTTMFILGMISVFVGISLLASDESKGGEDKDSSLVSVTSSSMSTDVDRVVMPSEDSEIKDVRSLGRAMLLKFANVVLKAKAACSLSLGLGEDSIHASSVLVMPMVSSKITGFRGSGFERRKFLSHGWSRIVGDEDREKMLETTSMLSLTDIELE
ncbi:hypothetical protein RJ639_012797 [Escallonia herrerae]|uniref:Probable magnesium transporter n=1 Tax=Escallonia herrerae TaxID=1293975 RepID=A0AA88VLM6_9ASTE|nr:hypothetical protein RJ639_012797 [Escallonia herrerae]